MSETMGYSCPVGVVGLVGLGEAGGESESGGNGGLGPGEISRDVSGARDVGLASGVERSMGVACWFSCKDERRIQGHS